MRDFLGEGKKEREDQAIGAHVRAGNAVDHGFVAMNERSTPRVPHGKRYLQIRKVARVVRDSVWSTAQ